MDSIQWIQVLETTPIEIIATLSAVLGVTDRPTKYSGLAAGNIMGSYFSLAGLHPMATDL